MANKSIYPPNVEVHARHLQNTETQRIATDRQIVNTSSTRGIISGLGITTNPSIHTTRINIAAGTAYAPNGEYMQLVTNQPYVALADYTAGIKNYVLLVYDETYSFPEAHETTGTTFTTIATVAPRLVILTEAEYLALPLNDAVLTNNDVNRACVLGIVTANGSGVALTAASVQSPTVFRDVLQSDQPANVTGVTILYLDPTTTIGTGTISFTQSTSSLTWKTPSDIAGTPVVVSTSGTYTLYSSTGKSLLISVVSSGLPSVNKSDNISITNIYAQSISRNTSVDLQHRSMLGSGIPSSVNPHGLTLSDLSPGVGSTVEEHQDIMHANGIVKTSSAALLSSIVNTVTVPDSLQVTDFSVGDAIYINGKRIESVSSSLTITFSDIVTNAASLYGVWINQDGVVFKQLKALYPVVSALSNKTQIVHVHGFAASTYTLTWTSGGLLSFASGPTKAAPAVDAIIRLYGSDRLSYIDVYVKGASTPGTTESDTITISADPGLEENLPICDIPFSGAATGFLGFGFGTANAPNAVYDTRLYGTMSIEHVRDDSGIEDLVTLSDDFFGSGIIARSKLFPGSGGINEVSPSAAYSDQLVLGTLAFPSVSLTGGIVYIDGRRLEIPTQTLTINNNTTNYIYINSAGTVVVTTDSWPTIIATALGKSVVRLYELVVSGGAEFGRTDRRNYLGYKKDEPLGVVGINNAGHVSVSGNISSTGTISANSVTASTVVTTSTITADGNISSWSSVSGYIGVTSNGYVTAGTYMYAGTYMQSGTHIQSGTYIQSGDNIRSTTGYTGPCATVAMAKLTSSYSTTITGTTRGCTFTNWISAGGGVYYIDITFSVAQPDANYAVVFGYRAPSTSGIQYETNIPTTTGFRIYANLVSGAGPADPTASNCLFDFAVVSYS